MVTKSFRLCTVAIRDIRDTRRGAATFRHINFYGSEGYPANTTLFLHSRFFDHYIPAFFSHYIPAFFKFDQYPGTITFPVPLYSRFPAPAPPGRFRLPSRPSHPRPPLPCCPAPSSAAMLAPVQSIRTKNVCMLMRSVHAPNASA